MADLTTNPRPPSVCIGDPLLHTNESDCLPDDHRLANANVDCDACEVRVHAFNNECMRTWVEMPGRGNFCLECYAKADGYPFPKEINDG